MTPLDQIYESLIKIEKRAEHAADEKLADTFVDAAPLLASVSTRDHQVLFGRRGTGKTHILKYLHDTARRQSEVAIYIDLRSVGSNGSIYSDFSKTKAQRATPLLLDVMQALHESLLRTALDFSEEIDLSVLGPSLDKLADCISEVAVTGTIELSEETSQSLSEKDHLGIDLAAASKGIKLSGSSSSDHSSDVTAKRGQKVSGTRTYYVNFAGVQSSLAAVLSHLKGKHVWLLLDEWSEVPLDLQPYLADLLRRCVIPVRGITIKIAAIEHRSQLSIGFPGEYIGIELGADAGGDVNLDDFMVFDNSAARSKQFFSALLFKHYRAADGLELTAGPQSPDALIHDIFTQITAFEEFVRAIEGVPRDAVYLASMVARRAYGRKISVQDVRAAARDWYQRDKSTPLKSEPRLAELLNWIIQEVIAHRRARAFLFPSLGRHHLIDTLFDTRLVHILKKNISSHDEPGKRYDVYKLDYGCYVDLITSTRAPLGLLPIFSEGASETEGHFIDVPPDDYRSIRGAILKIEAFDRAVKMEADDTDG